MKAAAIAAGLALLFAAPAWAQNDTAGQNPAAAQDAATRLTLARQMVEANGGIKQAEAQVDAMFAVMYGKMAEGMPSDQQAIVSSLQRSMQREMHGLIPPMIDMMVRLYATNFTEQELRDVLAFQTSPSGQAFAHKMPAMMQQMMVEMVPLIKTDMPKLMHSVMEDVCTEEHCTAEQRKTLQAAVEKAIKPGAGA